MHGNREQMAMRAFRDPSSDEGDVPAPVVVPKLSQTWKTCSLDVKFLPSQRWIRTSFMDPDCTWWVLASFVSIAAQRNMRKTHSAGGGGWHVVWWWSWCSANANSDSYHHRGLRRVPFFRPLFSAPTIRILAVKPSFWNTRRGFDNHWFKLTIR